MLKSAKSTLNIAKIILVVVFFSILSCNHKGQLKYEKGIVVEKQYFPDTKNVVMGTGVSSNGGVIITTHCVGDDEKYIVIFKCEHGVIFSINRSELYGSLNKNDSVEIKYYEVLDSENKLVDLDFVSAARY